MVLLVLPVVVGVLSILILKAQGSTSIASVRPTTVPAGYRSVSDGFVGYAIPSAWTRSSAWDGNNGDYFYQGRSGWLGESVGVRASLPVPGRGPPSQLEMFGQVAPRPYTLGPAHRVTIAGTDRAWTYRLSRPGGFSATAIEAWQRGDQTETWMLVRADPATTSTILATLRAR